MLQPARTKYRKQQKGRNTGVATRGAKVSFGEYGLKAIGRGRLTARQIAAARQGKPGVFRRGDPARKDHLRDGRGRRCRREAGVCACRGEAADPYRPRAPHAGIADETE